MRLFPAARGFSSPRKSGGGQRFGAGTIGWGLSSAQRGGESGNAAVSGSARVQLPAQKRGRGGRRFGAGTIRMGPVPRAKRGESGNAAVSGSARVQLPAQKRGRAAVRRQDN